MTTIYEAIKNLCFQFGYEPKIENQNLLKKLDRFIVVGMGGSHLAADLIKVWNPYYPLIVHQDYGLPALPDEELKSYFLITSSYSGNTEEALDAYEKAKEKGMALGAISLGGKLIELAQKDGAPFIQLPDTGIQPRSAVGFMLKAMLKMMGEEETLEKITQLHESFHPENYEKEGKALAGRLKGFIPLIYASARNAPLASNWKVRFNETGKIPAFWNVFPELNHNEMTGFDIKYSTRPLSERFYIIFLKDISDSPKIKKRMEITQKLYRERGLKIETIELRGETLFHKIFSALTLADWTAYYIAKGYGVDPEQVPMVEEFKGLIQNF